MRHRIHVNQHVIKANKANDERQPPLTVKNYKTNIKATRVEIAGPCTVVYSPDAPLDWGAHV